MNKFLIKEYVKLLLEASFFKDSELKSMKSISDIHKYASKNLTRLGIPGSSRTAYLISSNKVLKVAMNEKGFAQNEAEVDVYTSPASKPITTKIFDYDPYFKWVKSELVRPFTDENNANEEFEKKYNISFTEFVAILRNFSKTKSLEVQNGNKEFMSFLKSVIQTKNATDLVLGDIIDPKHWGMSTDGRIILLDYGFTREVATTHYSTKASKSQTDVDSGAVTYKVK